MSLPSILIKLALLLFAGMCYGAYYGWQQVQPIIAELREKDPGKFDLLVGEAKSLHFKKAEKLYHELDEMTPWDVVYLRYSTWREKRRTDKEFRESYEEEQFVIREQENTERKSRHEQELRALAVKLDENGKLRIMEWKKSEPWQKSMVLREKCIKYFTMEEMDSRRRKNALELSRISSILDRPRKASWSIPEYCMSLVPATHDNEIVLRAVQRLEGEMNYYYYSRMLEEIGVPKEDLKFDQQLKGLSQYFTDS